MVAPVFTDEELEGLRRFPEIGREELFRQQTEQAGSLTLVTNAVVTWTTESYGLADEVLAHISPAHSNNINFFGAIEVDIEGELAQLGPTGYRPLRVRDTLF